MSTARFWVSGQPAPQGSKRNIGGGRMIEASAGVGPWRDRVAGETQRLAHPQFTGPTRVTLRFLLIRPAAHLGARGVVKASAPRWPGGKRYDLDKLVRAVLDGLTDGGLLSDDGNVAWLRARKEYAKPGHPAGAQIEVTDA